MSILKDLNMNSKTEYLFHSRISRSYDFSEQDWLLLAQYWYPIALARDITEQPRNHVIGYAIGHL
jgi:vanillate O-demethylase monooxygenase subunit